MIRTFFVLSALLFAQAASAEILQVGDGQAYATVKAADDAAHAGDTIRIAAGEHFDCAVIRHSNITIEGTGKPEDTLLTDKACQGKASLVIQGSDVTVRNITLTRIRVPDGNGAGIRSEGANLTIDHVRFVNNQDGILTSDNPNSTLTVKNSEFLRNGACVNACAHGIYAGHIKLLHVENSRFFETKEAHHIKSRAARTEVIGCDIEDGKDGTASYSIELPNGGSLLAEGNTIQKGARSGNHTGAIVIGAEGVSQPTRELIVRNNNFHKDGDYPTAFVVNLTATEAELVGNKITGSAKALSGDGSVH